jgi:uncharacterized protein YqjF (DUF2071 family)
MRVVIAVAIVLIAVFGFTRWRAHQAEQEAERREQQVAKEHAEWRKGAAERQQREDQRIATVMNCGTASNNMKVLEEALRKGTGVEETGPGLTIRKLEPHEVSATHEEMRQFIEKNCRR